MSPDFVVIAANPRAGRRSRGRHIDQLAERLRSHGQTVEIATELERAEALANRLHDEGRLRALVAAGGDGTLAELMNRTRPGTPLAIYPCGTANLVAHYVGVTLAVEAFAAVLMQGAAVELDAGRANGRLFLAVCSCGFDAEVAHRLHASRRGNITQLSYLWPILSVIRSYRFPTLRILPDDETARDAAIHAKWAFISNLPCYAMGLQPGVGATGYDGRLDLCAFEHGGLLRAIFRYLPALLRGTQHKLPDCVLTQASRFRVECPEAEVFYELDGDPGGTLPVEIDILPRRLTLLVPQAFADLQKNANPSA